MQTFVTQQWKQSKEKSSCLHNKKLSEKKVKSPLHLFSTLRRWVTNIFPHHLVKPVIFHGYFSSVYSFYSLSRLFIYFLMTSENRPSYIHSIKKHRYSFICLEFVFYLCGLNLLKLHFFFNF